MDILSISRYNHHPHLLRLTGLRHISEANTCTPRTRNPESRARVFQYHPTKGAEACATFNGLIETAKANGLKPYHCLRYLLNKLPFAKTQNHHRNLLPMYLEAEDLATRF